MGPDVSLYELVNPLVMLLFAAGFFGFWKISEGERSAGWFFASYVCAAIVFFCEFLRNALPLVLYTPLTNVFYSLTAALFSIALTLRAGNRPKYLTISLMAFLTASTVICLGLFGYGVTARTMVAHIGNALVFAMGILGMRGHINGLIDRTVFGLSIFNVAQLLVMPLVFYAFQGVHQTMADYQTRGLLETFQLVIACAAVSVAMLLLIGYTRDVIERYRDEATHDKLTGILNRRGFEEQAGEILRKADEEGYEVCFIMTDIDHFKTINDTYGHSFGDSVIKTLGRMFGGHINADGCVGRLGGEEFAMIRPVGSLDEARSHAELLRMRWERLEFDTGKGPKTFTASFGVAIRMQNEPITAALVRADDALYLAKSAGRNCTKCQQDTSIAQLKMAGAVMASDDPATEVAKHAKSKPD